MKFNFRITTFCQHRLESQPVRLGVLGLTRQYGTHRLVREGRERFLAQHRGIRAPVHEVGGRNAKDGRERLRAAGSIVVLEARPSFLERLLRVSTDVDR